MNSQTYQVTLLQLHEFIRTHVFVHVIVIRKDALAINRALHDISISHPCTVTATHLCRALPHGSSQLINRSCSSWHVDVRVMQASRWGQDHWMDDVTHRHLGGESQQGQVRATGWLVAGVESSKQSASTSTSTRHCTVFLRLLSLTVLAF